MFIAISKLLTSLFLDPVGITLVILAAGIAVAVVLRLSSSASPKNHGRGKRKWMAKIPLFLFVCGFSSLLVFSSPITAHFLMRGLEGQYLPQYDYGQASAVVLLGGSTIGKMPPRIHVEINRDGNRILKAARVWKQGAAPYLVLSGGIVDCISEETVPEAQSKLELLKDLFGIDADSGGILIESTSRTTRENAVNTKAMMEEAGLGSDIILVTSAYHMPRSAAVFKKAGFEVTPAPTGYFRNDFISKKPLTWLPGTGTLLESAIAVKEYSGILVYKFMGWI